MEQAAVILFWLAFVGFVAASVLFAYQLLLKRPVAVPPQMVTGIALIIYTTSIGLNSIVHHGTQMTGGNQLVLASWALFVLFFVVEYLFKFKQYGGVLVPAGVVLMIFAMITSKAQSSLAPMPSNISAQMESAGIGFHVALIVFANMLFLIGAIASALYLYQAAQLKNNASGLLGRRLPSLSNLENLATRSITIALPIYLGGQLLGIIRAINVDAAGWWADPRVMLSGLVFVMFAVYMVLMLRNKLSGQTTARIAIAGGCIVIALMVIARTVPLGFHVFGVL